MSGGLPLLVRFHLMDFFYQLLSTSGKYLILWPLHTCAVMIMQLEGMICSHMRILCVVNDCIHIIQ